MSKPQSPQPLTQTTLVASDIERLAAMSRLRLSPEEVALMTDKLNAIFQYVSVLQTAQVEGVQPMSHVHEVSNVTREDTTVPSMAVEELLKLAPEASGRFIKTPLVIEG